MSKVYYRPPVDVTGKKYARNFSGRLPDILVVAMGTMLIVDSINHSFTWSRQHDLMSNFLFLFGVLSWLTLICQSISHELRVISNILSTVALCFYLIWYHDGASQFDWIMHSFVIFLSVWFLISSSYARSEYK